MIPVDARVDDPNQDRIECGQRRPSVERLDQREIPLLGQQRVVRGERELPRLVESLEVARARKAAKLAERPLDIVDAHRDGIEGDEVERGHATGTRSGSAGDVSGNRA